MIKKQKRKSGIVKITLTQIIVFLQLKMFTKQIFLLLTIYLTKYTISLKQLVCLSVRGIKLGFTLDRICKFSQLTRTINATMQVKWLCFYFLINLHLFQRWQYFFTRKRNTANKIWLEVIVYTWITMKIREFLKMNTIKSTTKKSLKTKKILFKPLIFVIRKRQQNSFPFG